MSSELPPVPWFSTINYNPSFFTSSSAPVSISYLNSRQFATVQMVADHTPAGIFGIPNICGITVPSMIAAVPNTSAYTITSTTLSGLRLYANTRFSNYIFYAAVLTPAVAFRFALYDSTWTLVPGSDTGVFNAQTPLVAGGPIYCPVASPITISLTGTYYIGITCNVLAPIGSFYSGGNTSPYALINNTNVASVVLVSGGTPVRSGTGTATGNIPMTSLVGITLNYIPAVPLVMLL